MQGTFAISGIENSTEPSRGRTDATATPAMLRSPKRYSRWLRDELERDLVTSLGHAREALALWQLDYNTVRPLFHVYYWLRMHRFPPPWTVEARNGGIKSLTD